MKLKKNESSYNSVSLCLVLFVIVIFSLQKIYFMNNKAPSRLTSTSLSQFLFYSLSLSAWKSHGDTAWSLRVNPSSGNLHPSEGYVLLPPVSGMSLLFYLLLFYFSIGSCRIFDSTCCLALYSQRPRIGAES